MVNEEKYKLPIGLALWFFLIAFIFSTPFIPLTLDEEIDVSFLDQEGNENALVFFGFRACSDVCPMTLSILRQLVDSQVNTSKWPQVVFVDVDLSSSSLEASNYAKQFHTSFVGLHISNEKLIEVSTKFGLNIKQEGNQITHLGKTYLLRREAKDWKLVKIYNPNSLSVETLKKELFALNY
jgi:protein SCO1/2